jgi:hypothetical protein
LANLLFEKIPSSVEQFAREAVGVASDLISNTQAHERADL